jgi:hypothetical protein
MSEVLPEAALCGERIYYITAYDIVTVKYNTRVN